MARIFFRSVKTERPTADDFRSHAALGHPPPRGASARLLHEWDGLSVFDSLEGARANAAAVNWRIGMYITEVHIPEDAQIAYEGPGRRGHWNLYGADPDLLLQSVVRVLRGPSFNE